MFDPATYGVREATVRAARDLQPRMLDRDGAVAALADWTIIANAAAAVCSLLAARIDECGPPPSAGASSAADYVAKATGTTSAKAKQRIKTGKRLRKSSKTRAKATSGSLSGEQSDAIADTLDVDPTAEDDLLDTADRTSLGELRDECARRKAAADDDPDATQRRIHANRKLRRYRDGEGAEHLHAVGTKQDLAALDLALKPFIDAAFTKAREAGTREPLEAYAFDALIAMANASGSDTSGTTTPPVKYLGLLRIDLEALARGTTEASEVCEIAGLGPIPIATARDLLGDSILKLVITRGVDVANVTHLGRGPTTAQKVALLWQQPVCSRQGCGRRLRLENDHRHDWALDQVTELHNLDHLCNHDHRLKTTKGWALINGTGTRPMVPPTDPRHPRFHTTDRDVP